MIMLKCKKIFQKKSGGKKMIHILHGRNVYHFFYGGDMVFGNTNPQSAGIISLLN